MLKGLSTNHGVSGEEGCPRYEYHHFCSRTHARHVETKSKISEVIADPTDNIFLECALDGSADFIISGNRHLLDIKVYRGIEIVKAGEFLLKEKLPQS